MQVQCPHCQALVSQTKNTEGPNFCPKCRRLFRAQERKLPAWILGVLTILVINWQIISHH